MPKKTDKAFQRLAKADKRLAKAEEDYLYLTEMIERIKGITKNADKLSEYYYKDWLEDVDLLVKSESKEHFECSNQDSIWNVLYDQHGAKLKLLKLLINDIAK